MDIYIYIYIYICHYIVAHYTVMQGATAGHECKHNACRAEGVSVVIPISEFLCYEGHACQCPGMISK